jgi:class 3 adenylate cyclase
MSKQNPIRTHTATNSRYFSDRLLDVTMPFDGLLKGGVGRRMTETPKLATILVADVVGYSRFAGADEDRIPARLRALPSDLIDPTIAAQLVCPRWP